MTLPATDTFTGTDGSSLSGSWTTVEGAFVIRSNGACGNVSGGSIAGWNSDTPNNDQYSQITFAAVSTGFVYVGPGVRIAAAAATGYVYGLSTDVNSYLDKDIAGTYTDIALEVQVPAATQVARIEVSGTSITCILNGVTKFGGAKTDSSISAGRVGIHAYGPHSADIPRIEAWEGGNLGAAATSLPIDPRRRAFAGVIVR